MRSRAHHPPRNADRRECFVPHCGHVLSQQGNVGYGHSPKSSLSAGGRSRESAFVLQGLLWVPNDHLSGSDSLREEQFSITWSMS